MLNPKWKGNEQQSMKTKSQITLARSRIDAVMWHIFFHGSVAYCAEQFALCFTEKERGREKNIKIYHLIVYWYENKNIFKHFLFDLNGNVLENCSLYYILWIEKLEKSEESRTLFSFRHFVCIELIHALALR